MTKRTAGKLLNGGQHALTVVSTTIEPGKMTALMEKLSDQRKRETILSETASFIDARIRGARCYLEMGEHLSAVRRILEPIELFLEYVRIVPGLSQATAYRTIYAYENASRTLPEATLKVAMAGGYKLVSNKKDEAYLPSVAPAIAKVEEELGPAPETDEKKAKEWLDRVVSIRKESITSPRRKRSARPDLRMLEKRILDTFEKAYMIVSVTDRKRFSQHVVERIQSVAGLTRKPVVSRELRAA